VQPRVLHNIDCGEILVGIISVRYRRPRRTRPVHIIIRSNMLWVLSIFYRSDDRFDWLRPNRFPKFSNGCETEKCGVMIFGKSGTIAKLTFFYPSMFYYTCAILTTASDAHGTYNKLIICYNDVVLSIFYQSYDLLDWLRPNRFPTFSNRCETAKCGVMIFEKSGKIA